MSVSPIDDGGTVVRSFDTDPYEDTSGVPTRTRSRLDVTSDAPVMASEQGVNDGSLTERDGSLSKEPNPTTSHTMQRRGGVETRPDLGTS